MSTPYNRTESGIVKSGFGKLWAIIVNSHTNGTLKLVDGTEGGVQATSTITSAGACAPADYARNVLTNNANVTDGDTVTIGAFVYRFKDTMLAAFDVKIGATAAISMANLQKAINATGTAGVEYFAGTTAHTLVYAYAADATTVSVVSRTIGTTNNTLATTETSGSLSWADTTLGGGTGASEPGVATSAATFTIDATVYTAVLNLAETFGLTAVAYQVLWVTSEAVFLDNVKLAINASGIAGTQYSTGTLIHPTVYATTNSNTQQVIVAKLIGSAQNSIATTTTLGNYSWTGTTLASGTGATGKTLLNTITFAAGPGFYLIDDADFTRGLYATVGGTLDYTLLVD